MTISERIFDLISKKGFTQKEFSRRTGIAESTISDWKKKGTNPVSDKILSICEVLEVSPYFLLSGKEKEQLSYTDIKPWASGKKKEDKKEDSKDKKNETGKDKDKHDSKEAKKPVVNVVKKEEAPEVVSSLPEIATVASDDMNYSIRAENEDKDTGKDKSSDKAKSEKKESKAAVEDKKEKDKKQDKNKEVKKDKDSKEKDSKDKDGIGNKDNKDSIKDPDKKKEKKDKKDKKDKEKKNKDKKDKKKDKKDKKKGKGYLQI